MRYVKIKAKNYNEAMMKLKMEHGDDAIPISHKYVKEGGLFNSKILAQERRGAHRGDSRKEKPRCTKKPRSRQHHRFHGRDDEVVKIGRSPSQQRVLRRDDRTSRSASGRRKQPVPG